MASVLVVGWGPQIALLGPTDSETREFPWGPDPERGAVRRAGLLPEDLPGDLVRRILELPDATVLHATGSHLASALEARSHRRVVLASLATVRLARSRLRAPSPDIERTFLRAVAARELQRSLCSPEEVLITLAREEERLERAVGREERAAESFLTVEGSLLERYAQDWKATRTGFTTHHARLLATLESEARRVLPNLSQLIGPRVAARMLSASGGLAILGRMSASRLQLLGSRRRPSPDRGPRFGVIYRADRMAEVPLGRRAAYARSLAALAAIAARADATTRHDLTSNLMARRDRRVEELRRRAT